MNIGDFPADQATHENLVGVSRCASGSKNRPTLLVCPPAAIDTLAGHRLREIRSGASARFEHNSMLFNEVDRIHEKYRKSHRLNRKGYERASHPWYTSSRGKSRDLQEDP